MTDKILKSIGDFIYGTNRVRKKYQAKHPDEVVLASDASKSITTPGDQIIQRGVEWVGAQRTVVMLTDKNIVSAKWTIPVDEIQSAKLIRLKSLIGTIHVLKVQTKDNKNYQFGMQYNPEWENQQRLPLVSEDGKITYSAFSIIVRVFAVGYLIYLLFERYF